MRETRETARQKRVTHAERRCSRVVHARLPPESPSTVANRSYARETICIYCGNRDSRKSRKIVTSHILPASTWQGHLVNLAFVSHPRIERGLVSASHKMLELLMKSSQRRRTWPWTWMEISRGKVERRNARKELLAFKRARILAFSSDFFIFLPAFLLHVRDAHWRLCKWAAIQN